MKFKILIAVLVLTGLAAYGYSRLGPEPKVKYSIKLGKPGNHSTDARLPELPMHIEFDQANARVISRQENGTIVAWDIKSGERTELAQTSELFAYCSKEQLLLIQASDGIILTDLKDSKRQVVIEGTYHHAVWNRDCSTFAIANQDAGEIKRWRTADISNHVVIYTGKKIRNGLAMSDDGVFIAAAEGTYTEDAGHDTKLEIFKIAEDASYTRRSAQDDGSTILGMWKMAFAPNDQGLIVGSQTNAHSGLRNIVSQTAGERWRQEGFASYWVRALATSPDGKLIATGDEKGWLRIWDTGNGRKLYERQTSLVVQSVSFSEDGKKLAVALWDSTIGILELEGF